MPTFFVWADVQPLDQIRAIADRVAAARGLMIWDIQSRREAVGQRLDGCRRERCIGPEHRRGTLRHRRSENGGDRGRAAPGDVEQRVGIDGLMAVALSYLLWFVAIPLWHLAWQPSLI